MASLDRKQRLAFLPLEDAEAKPFLARLPEEERLASWRLVERDGSLVGRGSGGVEVLRALPIGRPAARAFDHVPERLLDRAYELVARRRHILGRLVPDGAGPRRFP